MNKNIIIIAIIVALVSGGIGVFGGMKIQEKQTQNNLSQRMGNFNRNGQNIPTGGQGRTMAGRPVSGEIISQDTNGITVKLTDGSSKIIILSDKTVVSKTSDGTKSDLTTGTKVLISGQSNSDGSVTAQNIQINPLISF
jgi:hypothetical protein